MCDNAPMTTNLPTPPTVTITLPRSVARPLGILDRETDTHLTSRDEAWLARNINTRMTDPQLEILHKALTDAGVTL